jgi:hypothetical protein
VARLVDRDGNHCWYCGFTFSDGDRACTVDHVLPRSRGGTNVLANLRLACFYCNNRRGRMPAGVFEHSESLAARRRQAYRAEMLNTGRWLPKRAFHHAGIRWFGAQSWQCDDCSQGSLDGCASPASVPCAPWCTLSRSVWVTWWHEPIDPPAHWPSSRAFSQCNAITSESTEGTPMQISS